MKPTVIAVMMRIGLSWRKKPNMTLKLEYQDLLRYAVAHYRQLAGYIPPKMPLSHNWVDELTCTVINSRPSYETEYTVVYWTTVYLDTVCWDCLHMLRKSDLLPANEVNLFFGSQLGDWQTCEICANLGIESELPY